MLKCKNEATMLLKTKSRAWVRSSKRTPSEPVFEPNEPKIMKGLGTWNYGRDALPAIAYGAALD